VRTPDEIRRELDELAMRRTNLWQDDAGGNPSASTEIALLTARMDELWRELRESRLHVRHGSRETIIERARHHERRERDLRRTLEVVRATVAM
jgi:hypothetical protein